MRLVALALAVSLPGMATAMTEGVVAARYADPTDRYPHAVLGDAIEHGTLEMDTDQGRTIRLILPEERVFEDTEPRVVDVDGDGAGEVIVVEADQMRGARLAVYGPGGVIAATPFIGQRFRWMGTVGAADLDGDGVTEIALIDRPHLARTLRVYRFAPGTLEEVASLSGVTNHRIGERDIAGGVRDCGRGPEMIVADASWREVLAVSFDGTELTARALIPHVDRTSFATVLACAD